MKSLKKFPIAILAVAVLGFLIMPASAQQSNEDVQVTAVPNSVGEFSLDPTPGIDLEALGLPPTIDMIMGDLAWLPLTAEIGQTTLGGRSVLTIDYLTEQFGNVRAYIDDEWTYYSVSGQFVGPLPIETLDSLPGGKEEASAGASWCWDIPYVSAVIGPVQITIIGHGSSLAQAVNNFKQKTGALQNAGWKPVKCP